MPIDSVFAAKLEALDSHTSQFAEWLPWVDRVLDQVPADAAGRKAFIARRHSQSITNAMRATLVEELGAAKAAAVRQIEAFELCEYGRRPPIAELRKLFPLE